MNIHLQLATVLTKLMDEQFAIGKFKFGLDPVLGIVPGVGDILSLTLSFYIIFIAIMLRLPQDKMGIMIRNIIMDFLIGLVPVVGDLADMAYKANTKNLRILHEHVGIKVVEGEVITTS